MMRFRLVLFLWLPGLGLASVFDTPELQVAPSPSKPVTVHLANGIRVLDSDLSPTGPLAALLVAGPSGAEEVRFWKIDQQQPVKVWDVPSGLTGQSLAWHPRGDSFFVSGVRGQQYLIFKVETKRGVWTSRQIYSSRHWCPAKVSRRSITSAESIG